MKNKVFSDAYFLILKNEGCIYQAKLNAASNERVFSRSSNEFKIINKEDVENIIMYKLKNIQYKDELNYLNLLKTIFEFGDKRQTRNSITLSLFGKKLSFNQFYLNI